MAGVFNRRIPWRAGDIGVISPAVFSMMVLMALVTTFMTTPLFE